jgi:Ca2+-binding EF-hand superfamily protein
MSHSPNQFLLTSHFHGQKIVADIDSDGRGLLDFQEVSRMDMLWIRLRCLHVCVFACIYAEFVYTMIDVVMQFLPLMTRDIVMQFLSLMTRAIVMQFLSVMTRDIKNFDNETELKGAWKVFDRVS